MPEYILLSKPKTDKWSGMLKIEDVISTKLPMDQKRIETLGKLESEDYTEEYKYYIVELKWESV